jgi:hypothetical protein
VNKKPLLFIILIITISFIVIKETYAYYATNFNVNVSSTSSNIICDAEISNVTSSEKSKLGYSEFKVIVKNYNESNSITIEPFTYTLSIVNNDNSNGEFGYNNVFNNNLQLTGQMTNDRTTNNEYIIQVKTPSGLSENVSYKVLLNCTQTN